MSADAWTGRPASLPWTVVIAAGGTGGHLYPGMTLARALRERDAACHVVFIGTASGMEATLIPKNGFAFSAIRARAWVGKGIVARLAALFAAGVGGLQALGILRRLAPSVVVGIGGYASGPVLLAAILLRMKRVILEPNLVAGLANRKLAPFVDRVVIAFEAVRRDFRGDHVLCLGTPVREEVARAAHAPRTTGPFTLLVLGGSQGAHAINRAMVEALAFLDPKTVRIIHQTGKSDAQTVRDAYAGRAFDARVMSYIDEMAQAYAEADLVVSRAGAGTLAELAAVGLPAIFIPYPHAEAHQEKNAAVFVAAAAAEVIHDRDVSGARLAEKITALLSDPIRRATMAEATRRLGHPHAARDIVQLCRDLANVGAEGRARAMSTAG